MDNAYDLIVIGSGPAGQRAAIHGAKMGKRVAVVETREVVGGVCINTGTIPSARPCARPCCISPATTTARSTA